jgi:hypothetical protein
MTLASRFARLTPSPTGWAFRRSRGPLALRLNEEVVSEPFPSFSRSVNRRAAGVSPLMEPEANTSGSPIFFTRSEGKGTFEALSEWAYFILARIELF